MELISVTFRTAETKKEMLYLNNPVIIYWLLQ